MWYLNSQSQKKKSKSQFRLFSRNSDFIIHNSKSQNCEIKSPIFFHWRKQASTVSRPVILHNCFQWNVMKRVKHNIFPPTGAVEQSKRNRTRAQFCCTMDRYTYEKPTAGVLEEGGTERKQRPFSFLRKSLHMDA